MNSSNWSHFLFHLRREFLLQLNGRSSYSRGVYPGFSWFALFCVAVMLLEFNSSRLSPHGSSTVLHNFILLSFGQYLLIWLRSKVYCALSFSRDLQSQTVATVRVTPISKNTALFAKLCASLAPLWTELALFLPVSLLFFSVYLKLPASFVILMTLFLFFLSLISGSLGLAIGSLTSNPYKAMRNARFSTFLFIALIPLLRSLSSSWYLPLLGLGCWLLICSRRAPHRTLFLGASSFVLLALSQIPRFNLGSLQLKDLHPNVTISSYFPNSRYFSDFEPGKTGILELFGYPSSICLIYLAIAVIFFWVARSRFKYS